MSLELTFDDLDPQLIDLGLLIAAPREETLPRVMLYTNLGEDDANALLDRWRENLTLSLFIPQSFSIH